MSSSTQFKNIIFLPFTLLSLTSLASLTTHAGEFGYIKSAETYPEGALEITQVITQRKDKGAGKYEAYDYDTKFEYGLSNNFTLESVLKMQSVNTSGLIIDGYLPKEIDSGLQLSGFEISGKYKFLNTAVDPVGLSTYWGLEYLTKDPHSGQNKDTISFYAEILLQKYFLEGQLVWVANAGLETTRAKRGEINDLPEDFEWPTFAEMEIGLSAGTGVSYRVVNNWYVSVEALYEQEHETEVDKERYSLFAGPTISYNDKHWWASLTYFKQMHGGGEKFDEQDDTSLHLIEKTKQEIRLKVGFNF